MAKITDYPAVAALDASSVFLLDGTSGTKKMSAQNLLKALAEMATESPIHRMIFGGRYLGASLSAEQLSEIQAGTFKGMLVGDYWTINDVSWRIVDFDYWLNCGDTKFTSHHLVIMPDPALYQAVMNDIDTTEGGYANSKMRTENLADAIAAASAAFPGHVLTHREFLVNAVTGGKASGAAWFDGSVELPSEIMMYGSRVISPGNDGTTSIGLYTVSKTQLALYSLYPRLIDNNHTFWLRDEASGTHFAIVDNRGYANFFYASRPLGVRPVFPVG